jgi:uracil phosphoribosyltransferase
VHVVVVIASAEGLEFARRNMHGDTTFWIGAVDAELTPRKSIVPGLGDAGDLAYGAKDESFDPRTDAGD